jgi:IS30 family transposase
MLLARRYLSFAEEIALLRAQGCTMQEVACRHDRVASTNSRELRRTAIRSGGFEYRATTAQRHAVAPAAQDGPASVNRRPAVRRRFTLQPLHQLPFRPD